MSVQIGVEFIRAYTLVEGTVETTSYNLSDVGDQRVDLSGGNVKAAEVAGQNIPNDLRFVQSVMPHSASVVAFVGHVVDGVFHQGDCINNHGNPHCNHRYPEGLVSQRQPVIAHAASGVDA